MTAQQPPAPGTSGEPCGCDVHGDPLGCDPRCYSLGCREQAPPPPDAGLVEAHEHDPRHDHKGGSRCEADWCLRREFYRDLRRMDMTKPPMEAEDMESAIEAVWLDGWTVGVRGAARAAAGATVPLDDGPHHYVPVALACTHCGKTPLQVLEGSAFIAAQPAAPEAGLAEALTTIKASLQREYDGQRATDNAPYYANGILYALHVIDKYTAPTLAAAPATVPLDVERLERAVRKVWESEHRDLRSGLTTWPEDLTLARTIAAAYEEDLP